MARNDYGVVFNGRRIVHPGAYDAIDANGMVVSSTGSLDVPIVIGQADSGKPGEVAWFTNPDSGRAYLRGGDLVTAMELMFSPTPEGGGGASMVGVMIVNPNTQATLTAGGISLLSDEYGDGGNRVQVKMEAGTIANSKKITASRWDIQALEVYDNLGAIIKIQYTGAAAYAAFTTTVTTGNATKFEIKTGADAASATVDVTVDLTDPRFATTDQLVRYLGSFANYQVSYVNGNNNSDMSTKLLDAASAIQIKASAGYVMAIAGDINHQIDKLSNLVSVTATPGPITTFVYTYLTGGVKGAVPVSWVPQLDTIKKEFSDVLVALTDSSTIHAEALAHVQVMEQRGQKQMLFTGGAIGETADQVKRRALGLNSSRAVLAYPGIYYKTKDVVLAPYFTGAMLAGRVVGVDPAEPITFDRFNLIALERKLIAGDPEIDDLITSGVATLEYDDNGGIRLVQGITTYIGDNNTLYREISVRRGADSLSGQVRKALEAKFVGKKGVPATVASVMTATIDELEKAIRDKQIAGYRNIVVKFQGTIVVVDYEVAPIEPINFVLVTSHFTPDAIAA